MKCPHCSADNVENARFCAKCGTLMPPEEVEEKDPLIGQMVGGRYRIKRMLGEGGMGRVYEAERAIAGVTQRIAIKTLHPHLSKDTQVVARFNRECATVVQLKHPNTIRVEDFGQTDDGTLYIAMEFVDGTSVAKEIEPPGGGAMPPERVERIMEQVCGSLAEAHKMGIVHRDLKPDNVVLMNVGEDKDVVKVLDFGIAARKESTDAKKEQKLTQQGMVLGTPPYMSPEQFMGKELDPRSDIYSLGVMTYEMLTGKLPFDASTPWEWATKHMTAQPFPFEDIPTTADIPGKMKTAIYRALEKDPNRRQDNVKQFFEELRSGKIENVRLSMPSDVSMASQPGGTASMASFEGGNKGATQIGAPMPGIDPSLPAIATNTPPVGAVPLPPPATPKGGSAGGNKGLIFGLMGVAALMVLVAGGMLLKRLTTRDDTNGTLTLPTGSVGGPATVAPIGGSANLPPIDTGTAPPSTVKPPTTTAPPATTTAKAPALSGDEACSDAIRRANNGDANGAANSYRGCSGPGQANAKRAIGASIPGSVRTAANRGDCRGARATAAMGPQFGAPSINVDQQYPQCKGK